MNEHSFKFCPGSSMNKRVDPPQRETQDYAIETAKDTVFSMVSVSVDLRSWQTAWRQKIFAVKSANEILLSTPLFFLIVAGIAPETPLLEIINPGNPSEKCLLSLGDIFYDLWMVPSAIPGVMRHLVTLRDWRYLILCFFSGEI